MLLYKNLREKINQWKNTIYQESSLGHIPEFFHLFFSKNLSMSLFCLWVRSLKRYIWDTSSFFYVNSTCYCLCLSFCKKFSEFFSFYYIIRFVFCVALLICVPPGMDFLTLTGESAYYFMKISSSSALEYRFLGLNFVKFIFS